MAVVDSRDRGLGLGCGHLRGRLVLVIELRKVEFIWVGMLSYRRAEDADRHRAGGIDGTEDGQTMACMVGKSQSFIFIKPKEEEQGRDQTGLFPDRLVCPVETGYEGP